MDAVVGWADRWGELGIVMLGIACVVGVIWFRLGAHERKSDERDEKINTSLGRGDERMNGLDAQMARGTAKMDGLAADSRENTANIAKLDERSKTQGAQLVRVESLLNQLVGFHTRKFTDSGDEN